MSTLLAGQNLFAVVN